jgi:hypothetical protein
MKRGLLLLVVLMVCFTFIVVSSISVLAGQGQGQEKNKPEYPIKLPQTGQKSSQVVGDDGYYQKGVVWPDPRFTDNIDGTVTDNLTGLVWLKDANCFGDVYWYGAIAKANNLHSGDCGLTDGSVAGDWRIPNRNEFLSLIDVEIDKAECWDNTALPCIHPFIHLAEGEYWTSTRSNDAAGAWTMYLYIGQPIYRGKSEIHLVWPVRSQKDDHHGHDSH